MDAVGVDKAVLHASLPTNRYYGRVARAYPGRFLPVAYLPYDEDVDDLVAALTRGGGRWHGGAVPEPITRVGRIQ